jgi:hypothetical protein
VTYHRRVLVLILSLVILCCFSRTRWPGGVARALTAPAAQTAQAMQPTAVNVVQPTGATGAGLGEAMSCTGSAVLTRPGVWRCNTIDPCFSLPDVTTYVICNVDLATGLGQRLNLSQPLDPSLGWQNVQASAMRLDLDNGLSCTAVGGATFTYQNQRANYQCSESVWIVGQPQPGLIWTVITGTVIMTPEAGPQLDPSSITTVAVRVAWV